MNKEIPIPTPPEMLGTDESTKTTNVSMSSNLKDTFIDNETSSSATKNNTIEKKPVPPNIDNDNAIFKTQSEVKDELKNNADITNINNGNNKSKSLNKIIFIMGGLIIFVFVIFFLKYQSENNSGFSSKTLDDKNEEVKVALNGDVFCQDEYNKLLSVNEFDFNAYCTSQDIRTGDYDDNKIPEKKKNLVLIFDASGSMAAQIDGKRKIDIAKEAAWKFIDQVDGEENFALSIVVYGHKGSNSVSQKSISCAGIEEVYYLGNVDAEIAKSKLNAFDATGWTPIAGSFKKAQEILSKHPEDENFILLVSDGKEMCDGDPVAAITALRDVGLNVKADVIGFDVGGADEEQLKAIAEAGGGDYFSVSSAIDLENAFAKHKELLNEADFKIGRTVEQLYDISFVINTYNQCRVMLQKEQAAMMLDIHASKLVGEKCEDFSDKQYRERFDELKKEIETNYKADKSKFDALK
jgi:Mg-chelatase subunit ChlD